MIVGISVRCFAVLSGKHNSAGLVTVERAESYLSGFGESLQNTPASHCLPAPSLAPRAVASAMFASVVLGILIQNRKMGYFPFPLLQNTPDVLLFND